MVRKSRGSPRHAGMRLRGVLIHEVFRKVLYLTPSERAKFSSGRIYSHVTSDVETIQQLSWSGLGIISSPLRIIGAWPTLSKTLSAAATMSSTGCMTQAICFEPCTM